MNTVKNKMVLSHQETIPTDLLVGNNRFTSENRFNEEMRGFKEKRWHKYKKIKTKTRKEKKVIVFNFKFFTTPA